jgi:hypothetical protein
MIQKATDPAPPRDLFGKVLFRESGVSRVALDAGRLALGLDLLNYFQDGHDPAHDPETSEGELSFEGVSVLELDPEDALSPLPKGTDAEILRLDAVEERDGRPVVTLVLQRIEYATHEHTTLVARFHATSAAWRPD